MTPSESADIKKALMSAFTKKLAFDKLYRELAPRMFAAAKKKLLHPEYADDVVQEVFAQLWTFERYDEISGSFDNYVFQICLNRIIKYNKKYRIEDAVFTGENDEDVIIKLANYGTISDELARDLKIDLELSSKNLKPIEEQTFELSVIRDMSRTQVKDEMKVNEKTVTRTLMAAKEKIAALLFPGRLKFSR
jgi:RNA polymerase sigma factor (sigma-70 family)